MCEMLCEDWEREYKRKVTDKERGRDERDTEEGKREKKRRGEGLVLIGLCGHAGL